MGTLCLQKVAATVMSGNRLPYPDIYEGHLAGKVNFSVEMALHDRHQEYWVGQRPKGDVYEDKWAFNGVRLLPTDLTRTVPEQEPFAEFKGAFERFVRDELGGEPLQLIESLGWAVAHDPPRGPYIQFIFRGETTSSFTKTDGLWLPKREIEVLDLVPSHRRNIFSRLP